MTLTAGTQYLAVYLSFSSISCHMQKILSVSSPATLGKRLRVPQLTIFDIFQAIRRGTSFLI